MNKEKRNYIITVGLLILFVIFVFCLKKVNVDAIGPEGGKVGFASINKKVFDKLGQNAKWDKCSDYIAIVVIATVPIFALIGFVQMIKRKSLLKVDGDVLMFGGFYVVVLGFYELFEKIALNCRPIIDKNEIEASFPSSHTLIAVCFLGGTMLQVCYRIKNVALKIIVNVLCVVLMVAMAVMRLLAGMHWFTDVVGAILAGMFLLMLYYSCFYSYLIRKKGNGELSFYK